MILYSLSSISFPDLRLHHLEVEALQAEWGWRFSTNGPPQGVFRLVTCGPPKNMCAACRIIAPSQHLATSKHIDVTMDEKLENTPNCYKVYIYININISFTKNARKKPRLQLGEQESQPGVCVPAVLDFLGSVARKWASEVEAAWQCWVGKPRSGRWILWWFFAKRWDFQIFLKMELSVFFVSRFCEVFWPDYCFSWSRCVGK